MGKISKELVESLAVCAIGTAVCVLLIWFIIWFMIGGYKQSKEAVVNNIEVSGTGSIKVLPDIALIEIGVTSRGTDITIQEENDATMHKVLEAIKELGVLESDIRTTGHYLQPIYDYSKNANVNIIGYNSYNVVEVTITNIDNASNILSTAVDTGANINNGIRFKISNEEEYYNQAIAKAIANGKDKAAVMAESVNTKNLKIVNISEINNQVNYARSYAAYDTVNSAGAGTPIEAGEIEITANVNIVFSY